MDEPTFDVNGYPTDETLDAIEHWPINKASDAEALMDFIGRAWSYPDYWRKQDHWRDQSRYGIASRTVYRYTFSTGGWSGNESLVTALEHNVLAQMLGAYSWRVGGHYEYRFSRSYGT